MHKFPRLVVAGIRGGAGKTTASLAVIRALRLDRGLRVVPFKKGPDYIDAGWLALAAGTPCYNLDPFLMSRERLVASFVAHSTGDVAIIEGNRGLHDGVDTEGSYSTAELAKLIAAPVLLVVDCTKITRTAAALVLGCMKLDDAVAIRGVILNQVSGSRHESVIRSSIESYCSVPVVGSLPRFRPGDFPERHMGLTPYQEHHDVTQAIKFIDEIAARYLDVGAIHEIATGAGPLVSMAEAGEDAVSALDAASPGLQGEGVTIGVIKDSAFQFYYPENFEELERRGASLRMVNALEEGLLPGVDALYIGGGFPETNALRLAENATFRESVLEAAERGLPIYAECGGLMFLGDEIAIGGRTHPMVGLLPLAFEMRGKPQAHGYTIAVVTENNPFYPVGTVLHGHEFHYSEVTRIGEKDGLSMVLTMRRGRGIVDKKDGICYKNVFATYTHVHALGAAEWVEGLMSKAKDYKERNERRHT